MNADISVARNSSSVINNGTDLTHRPVYAIVISAIFLIAIMLLAILGNLTVILAVHLTKSLKDELSNIFIINLSITDLLSAIIVMTSSLAALTNDDWPFGAVWCNVVCASNYCLIIVSMLTLCFISIDRYQAIIHPLHYITRMTKARIIVMIIYSWLQGFIFAVIPAFLGWVKYDYWEVVCAIQWHVQYSSAVYYVITAFIMCFLSPGLVLIYCYSQILGAARKLRIQPSATVNGVIRNGNQRDHVSKTIRSLLIVIIAYFICMTPFSLTKLLKVILPNTMVVPTYVNLVAAWTGYLSSATNPLIYGIFRKDFRMAFKITLRKLFCPKQPLNLHSTSAHYASQHTSSCDINHETLGIN